MENLPFIETAILIAAGVVLITKTLHFYLYVYRKKLIYWFYFSNYNIVNSRNEKSRKAKKLQNLFTVILIILLFVGVLGIKLYGP
jgi:hypothetical protein